MSNFFLRSARFRLLQPNKACVGARMRTVGSWGHYLKKNKKKFDAEFFFQTLPRQISPHPAFYIKKWSF